MEGVEVGVDLYELGTSAQTVLANAKWQFMQESDNAPAVAVGLRDLTRNGLLSSWYVCASKDVGPLRLHLGYMDDADGDGRGMFGVEHYFGSRTSAMLDYTTGPDMYHTAGVYYDVGDGVWGGLYYARNNTRGARLTGTRGYGAPEVAHEPSAHRNVALFEYPRSGIVPFRQTRRHRGVSQHWEPANRVFRVLSCAVGGRCLVPSTDCCRCHHGREPPDSARVPARHMASLSRSGWLRDRPSGPLERADRCPARAACSLAHSTALAGLELATGLGWTHLRHRRGRQPA